jgi:hypothetical protein
MPDCTPYAFWQQFLPYVLPPVAGLLSTIALWVASKTRSTSQAAQEISQEAKRISVLALHTPEGNESLRAAQDRRKS